MKVRINQTNSNKFMPTDQKVMKLFDLNIDRFPCGFDSECDYAKTKCSQGCYIDAYEDEKYFYDPIGYKARLKELFIALQKKGKEIYDSCQTKEDLLKNLTVLLKIDSSLSLIFSEWISNDYDNSCFDPKTIEEEIGTFEIYFSERDDLEDYEKWKLVCSLNKYDIREILD